MMKCFVKRDLQAKDFEAYLGPCQTCMMKLFCQIVAGFNYFRKKTKKFVRVLNTRHINLLTTNVLLI